MIVLSRSLITNRHSLRLEDGRALEFTTEEGLQIVDMLDHEWPKCEICELRDRCDDCDECCQCECDEDEETTP